MLGPHDVTVDSHNNPAVVMVYLRHSKADPFGAGVRIHLGRTGQVGCPVAALLGYLYRRGQQPGPLFVFRDGSTLSRQRLMARVSEALQCPKLRCPHKPIKDCTAGCPQHSSMEAILLRGL